MQLFQSSRLDLSKLACQSPLRRAPHFKRNSYSWIDTITSRLAITLIAAQILARKELHDYLPPVPISPAGWISGKNGVERDASFDYSCVTTRYAVTHRAIRCFSRQAPQEPAFHAICKGEETSDNGQKLLLLRNHRSARPRPRAVHILERCSSSSCTRSWILSASRSVAAATFSWILSLFARCSDHFRVA